MTPSPLPTPALSAILLSCLLAYLLGSIPFGLILGKCFGAGDIRKIGSGNIGATNMLRTGRKGLATATLFFDFFKGVAAIGVAHAVLGIPLFDLKGDVQPFVALAGVIAVLGHIFPIWLRFKGGKGVATTLGVFFATAPLIGFTTALGWIMFFYLTRISSLAAMASIIGAPVLGFVHVGPVFAAMGFVLALIILFTHRENIRRLRNGEEHQWKETPQTETKPLITEEKP